MRYFQAQQAKGVIDPHEHYNLASLTQPIQKDYNVRGINLLESQADAIVIPGEPQEGGRQLLALKSFLALPFLPRKKPACMITVASERISGVCAVVSRDRCDHRFFGVSFQLTKLRGHIDV